MSDFDRDDLMLRMLARLPAGSPDAARAHRTLARCLKALGNRRRELERRESASRLVEPILIGGLSLVYALAFLQHMIKLGDMF